MTRVLNCTALREAGFLVETVGLNDETQACLRRSSAAVLLVDLDLGHGQGFNFIQEGRRQPGTRNAFIIALTSDTSERIERKAAKAGADLVLNKSAAKPGNIVDRIKRGRNATDATADADPVVPVDSPAQVLVRARRDLQILLRSTHEAARADAMHRFAGRINALATAATATGQTALAAEAAVFGKALRRLTEKPGSWTAAATRTLAQALDLLNLLAGHSATPDPVSAEPAPRSAVIVTANRHLAATLQAELTEFGFHVRAFEHTDEVLISIRLQAADLVAVDVNIPGMSSLMVCAAVREMPGRCRTPFLFVAAPTDLVARSHMMLLGRADIVVHPTHPAEVILKALTLVLQSRAERRPTGDTDDAAPISPAKPRSAPPPEATAPENAARNPEPVTLPAAANTSGLSANPAAVIGVDESWTLVSINDAGRLLLDCVENPPEGRNLREWFPIDLPASPRECALHDSDGSGAGKTAPMSASLRIPGQNPLAVRMRVNQSREAGTDTWLILMRPDPGALSSAPAAGAMTLQVTEGKAATIDRHLEHLLTITVDDRDPAAREVSMPQIPPTMPIASKPSIPVAPTVMDLPQYQDGEVPLACSAGDQAVGIESASAAGSSAHETTPGSATTVESIAAPLGASPAPFATSAPPEAGQDECGSAPDSSSETPALRKLRARATHLEKASAALKERLERSLEAAAQSAAEAQREQSERRRAMQQVVSLTARLSKLHGEMRDLLANDNSSRLLQENLETRCREQAEALITAQAQSEQHRAEKSGLEERLRASQELAGSMRKQITEIQDSHARTAAGWNDIEERLNAGAGVSAELSARLQEETAARRQLHESLRQLQSQVDDATRHHALESHRLRAELQNQVTLRTQFEASLEELRFEANDTEETRHNELHRLESRLRQPATGLMKTLTQLLESEMTKEQRFALEAALGNVSLIQSHLGDLAGMSAHRERTRLGNSPALVDDHGNRIAVESCSSEPHQSNAKQF